MPPYKEQVKWIFAETYYIDFRKKKSVPSEKQQEIYSLITDLRKRFLLSHTPDFFTHNSSKPNDCIYSTAQHNGTFWEKIIRQQFSYRGSPTYMVFTTPDSTTVIFVLGTRKWGIFVLVGDPLQFH